MSSRSGGVPPFSSGRPAPPESTFAEAAYLKQLCLDRTPVLVKLVDGEKLRGWIEYYDDRMVRLTRSGEPNLFIFKTQISYIAEQPRPNR